MPLQCSVSTGLRYLKLYEGLVKSSWTGGSAPLLRRGGGGCYAKL